MLRAFAGKVLESKKQVLHLSRYVRGKFFWYYYIIYICFADFASWKLHVYNLCCCRILPKISVQDTTMSLKYGVPVWAHVFWEWVQDINTVVLGDMWWNHPILKVVIFTNAHVSWVQKVTEQLEYYENDMYHVHGNHISNKIRDFGLTWAL